MCGRFTLTVDALDAAAAAYQLPPLIFESLRYRPRYNIAPTNEHLIVRFEREDFTAEHANWGLINSWAKDAKRAARQINARCESLESSRVWKPAFERRRCVVPADGWFEWTGPKEQRQPHWIHRPDGEPFLFAGLYERWTPRDGGDGDAAQPITTFTIITTAANEQLAAIHERMPVVLPNERLDAWLDPRLTDPAQLRSLLDAAPDDAFTSAAVSPRVNSVRNDDPDLLLPHEPAIEPAIEPDMQQEQLALPVRQT